MRAGLVDRDREAEADRAGLAAGLEPRVAIALLMPTTSPRMLTSGPPELPGLIAASVWIASMTVLASRRCRWLSPVRTGRFSALTMPLVTVPCRPSGEPIATTCSPGLEVGRVAERRRREVR